MYLLLEESRWVNFIWLSVVFIPGLEFFYFVITGCIYLAKIVSDKTSLLASRGNPSKASFLKYGPGKFFSGSSEGNIYVTVLNFLLHVVGEKEEIMVRVKEYPLWLRHILTSYLKNHIMWLRGQYNSQLISGILLK